MFFFRSPKLILVGFLAGLVTFALMAFLIKPMGAVEKEPDGPALIEKIREVARLETLQVSVYKKVIYEPAPPEAQSFFGEIATWASYTWDKPEGRAIVFANVHLGLDLAKLDESSLRVVGEDVEIVLPPIISTIEIKPGETEIIRSNLEPNDMMQMLDHAKWAIEADVAGDSAMQDRARGSAKRAIRAFLQTAGFRDVTFVEPAAAGAG